MAKKTGIGTLPHEIMMEKFRKEGRVHREELSLKALTLDHRLQARDKPLDLDHVKELHGYVKDGAVFPPIIVFRVDGKGKNYVGNGFHRCEVHKKEGRPSIKADVVSGTWQEAVEFATCCNFANAALTPNMADKKKACFMLLGSGWMEKSATAIAKHVGVSDASVFRWVSAYCDETGKARPKLTVSSNGRIRPTSNAKGGDRNITASGRNLQVSIAGKRISFSGDNKKEAANAFLESRRGAASALSSLSALSDWLVRRRVAVKKPGGIGRQIAGLIVRGKSVVFISDIGAGVGITANLANAIGRAIVLGESSGLAGRVILTLDPLPGAHGEIIDIARRLGIEFMTLEQFVEAVKADEGDAAKAV